MTETKTKTKPAPAAKVNRWTPEQIAELNAIVAAAPTAREGFNVAAKKLGKSPATIQQKYYALKRKAKPNKKRAATATVKPAASNGNTYSRMDTDELVAVAKQLRIEIQRRRKLLDEAAAALN